MPPSVEILKQRLENRKTEKTESIQMRLDKATYEISFSNQFNAIIQNNDLALACAETEKLIINFLNK
jgi:guanylate kinase